MKILLLIFLAVLAKAQDAKPPIVEGKWKVYETEENKKKVLVMTRVVENTDDLLLRDLGHFMEFLSDGTYSEYASAQCGLDDNRFHYNGKWSFQNLILTFSDIKVENDRPNIYHKYTVHKGGKLKFISQKENEIRFEIVQHWEKKTPTP